MKTFFNILQTLIGIEKKRYPDDQFIISENMEDNIFSGEKGHMKTFINTIYYQAKECKKENILSKNAFGKFSSLNSILENSFYEKELKEYILHFFIQAQKHYFSFSRLAHIYRIKKNKYVVTEDLMMNPLDPNHKLTFILVENKSNFLFNINEIINIIETAIGHAPNFFCEPLLPSNPYNNLIFSNATLYNIYFQMKKIGRVIPLLFHLFFLENFNKNTFIEQYEPNIREYAIKKYVFNSPHTVLYSSIISMLRHNEYTKKLTIDKDFPKDLLVDIFRPFLFHDYISNYYIKSTSKTYNSRHLLHIKLKKFYQFNPAFGRKTIKLISKNKKTIKKEYILNTKHISFYDICVTPIVNTNELFFLTTNSTINILINNAIFNVDDDNDSTSVDNSDFVNATNIYDHNNDDEHINNDNNTQLQQNDSSEDEDNTSNNEPTFWENFYNNQTVTSDDEEFQDENESIS